MSTGGRPRPGAGGFKAGFLQIGQDLKGRRHTSETHVSADDEMAGGASALEGAFRDGRRQRRGAGGQAEVAENFPCGLGWMNSGQNPEAAPASLTLQDVQRENSHHE